MSHLLAIGVATVSGLYAARVGLRVFQRMNTSGAHNFAKGDPKEFMNHLGSFDERMTVEEARLILGLEPGATKDDIKKTHRALMMRNHADQGGSPYLSSKINEAKEILMGPK
eukprot:TRINITY_DN35493_c0_g1_i1.p1 TRINITY_DN35493_c0_g1~~TRINITY_DN35493_c0_g1_i1.p1  ORF type:complete len:124 (+),score=22.45 TRINITY_DN35493_c0_g1_i1:39-374(+)